MSVMRTSISDRFRLAFKRKRKLPFLSIIKCIRAIKQAGAEPLLIGTHKGSAKGLRSVEFSKHPPGGRFHRAQFHNLLLAVVVAHPEEVVPERELMAHPGTPPMLGL